MSHLKPLFLVPVLCLATISLAAQQETPAAQSVRQAVIEMFSGGEAGLKKHLTLEMQQRLAEMMEKDPDSARVPLQGFGLTNLPGAPQYDKFDIGPILFSINNKEKKERFEVRIERNAVHGDEAEMELSLHNVRSGEEQQMPVGLRFTLELKEQESVWRLNAITLSAKLPLGDPRILDKSFWTPPGLSGSTVASTPAALDDKDLQPKMPALRAVRLVTMAEDLYAKKHPDLGYTCSLSDLVNIGKGLDNGEAYHFLDPEFANGIYNNYRFRLSGCDSRPAGSFRITAEPLSGRGRAYCSDSRRKLRASDDGQGMTCLVSGKVTLQ